MAAPHLALITGGHPFDREAFVAVFDALASDGSIRSYQHFEQPDAARRVAARDAALLAAEVVVLYDMPGLAFRRGDPVARAADPVAFEPPPPGFADGLRALCDAGTGLVVLHHAVASWPSWDGWAELVGARFHYQPGTLAGVDYPDSGYVFDVTHSVSVLDPAHPVCAGLDEHFTLTDELYCFPVLEDHVVPLLCTDFPTHDPSRFFSADLAIRGQRNTNTGWTHPAGSSLVGWVKDAWGAPLVYLQFGDGPATYADASFRRVLANSVAWAAGAEARTWARARQAAHHP